jgi:hypothetical protein
MIIFQILIAVAVVVGIMYAIDHHEEVIEQEERRARNRSNTFNLFVRNWLR